ncbi:exopolysaccharide biosynthesis protein [Metarhizobium album]|uniref:Exopolysaccharide biosynthesis protein n=1 Tax=Metarhizobium album TaxID=2182425 RepID=A0A2U2DPL2_9HYPH|nr:sugar transferase [Rhizobium album]PWE55256.1 exopolysaccharide biosynthesis protein [Rhizobium album]
MRSAGHAYPVFRYVYAGRREKNAALGRHRLPGKTVIRTGTGAYPIVKRAIDFTFSLFFLFLLFPFLLFIALLVRLESPGPALFFQRRWGRGGTIFRVIKFRSMRAEACDDGATIQAVDGDPRMTRIGAFLRRTNIDELPQLFNILRGEMSFVGPRCHPVGMLAANRPYEEIVPDYHARHTVRPGLTGLAQMRGWRGPATRRDKARARIACDLHYIRNMCFWLDARIMLATIRSELSCSRGF